MSIYRRLIFPTLRHIDAEWMHDQTVILLALAQHHAPGRFLLRALAGKIPSQPIELFGLTFPNVLGMAAGFDKDVRITAGLFQLGFGHVEVGTLTPRPQTGNPRPRVFRLPQDGALINQMGFPNEGVAAAVPRLRRLARVKGSGIVGVSLGKQKETPLGAAVDDYVTVMRAVYPYADYLAVNVSSPNTPGLRELQGGRYLEQLLLVLAAENAALAHTHHLGPRPLLLKIAPDLTHAELEEIVSVAQETAVAGVIATNTTLSRDGLSHSNRERAGGLSGRPLAARSTAVVAAIQRLSGGKLPVIGVGGVFTAGDVRAKLEAGARLVQLYTALVYEGPGLPGRLLRDLSAR
jgi:dihydroorotate dehydrogenase